MTAAQEPLPLLNDNPSSVDRLGFSALVSASVNALTRENLDPVCVGIFGPWGCGRTSVAHQVRAAMEKHEDVLVVYVEPWAFDPATDPKAHLIGIVLNAVTSHLSEAKGGFGNLAEDLRERILDLARRVRWTRAVRLAATSALTTQLPSLDDLTSVFAPADEDDGVVTEPSIDGFRDEFAALMADKALEDIDRIVVIVDDLDRCLSETVVDVLEAIKLFLAVPKMAFLVAADEAAVRSALASRYGDSPVAAELAERYLDKIVQIPVRVPVLDLADVEAYILQLLVLHNSSQDIDIRLREHCDHRRQEGKGVLIDELPDGLSLSDEHLMISARLAPLLYEGLDGNPRRIKRFLNEMWLRAHLAESRGIEVDHAAVAKLMVLEQVHEALFLQILDWVRTGSIEERLAAIDDSDGDVPIQLRRWSQMQPSIDPISMRRYMVLAASLRGSTVPTTTLPEHLRDVAGRLISANDAARTEAIREACGDSMSDEDRTLLGLHIVDVLRSQPSRQPDLAEGLARLIRSSDVAAESIVDGLRRLRAADLDVSLIANLSPPGGQKDPPHTVLDLLEFWRVDPDISGPSKKAIDQALRPKGA